MLTIDPVRLARRQIAIDRGRVAAFPALFEHKVDRMRTSPLALLRGSAPVFYWLIERHPLLAEGPAGEGWLVGDAHLENFGAYRSGVLSASQAPESTRTKKFSTPTKASKTKASKSSKVAKSGAGDAVVFDLNDFDDAFVGPWRLDVLRLLTSLILGGRELGVDGGRALALSDALLDAYVGSAFHRRKPPAGPAVVTHLIEKVRARTRLELLDARTEIVRGARRLVRGARYATLEPKLRAKAEKAFARYARSLARGERNGAEAFEVTDAAFRIAGTGSLGSLRIAVLVRGKGTRDGVWIFDMKAEGAPSAACLVRPPRLEPAERVCAAVNACLERPPRMIGTARLRGESMFVRRLSPQEDKLDLTKLASVDLEPLARHLGALLGVAHRRGATRQPARAWSTAERAGIVARAIALAGVHEAMYLAYCDEVRR